MARNTFHIDTRSPIVEDELAKANFSLEGKRVVDAGCNHGHWFGWYLDHGASEVVGVDHRSHLFADPPERCRFVEANLDLEYPDLEADVVFGFGLLYHLLNPGGFMLWAARTAPFVVIETALVGGDEPIWRMRQEGADDTMGAYPYAMVPTMRGLYEMVRGCRLDIKRDWSMDGGGVDPGMRVGMLLGRE